MRALLPSACVAGGSFASWLPKPQAVQGVDRRRVFSEAKAAAVRRTLIAALEGAGAPADDVPARSEEGHRLWPDGYVGSVTHKGTVVIVAVAPRSNLLSLGIDVEFCSDDGCQLDGLVFAEDEEAPFDPPEENVAHLMTLAAKEAVFKACYPLRGQRLAFKDVRLTWERPSNGARAATAEVPGGLVIPVRCSVPLPWICSSAEIIAPGGV